MSRLATFRLRAYNVGFGDCFLLTFSYADPAAERHVLIDFGTTALPTDGGPDSLEAVARKIKEHTSSTAYPDGKLHMVVVTHRHADHMTGFDGAAGDIILALKPDLVVQPWTEAPNIDPDAVEPPTGSGAQAGGGPAGGGGSNPLRAFTASLNDMHLAAAAIGAQGARMAAAGRGLKTVTGQVAFLGETNIKNPGAVRNLMEMGKRRVYARFGTRLPIGSLLPGVKIEVLGPPTLKQSPGIANLTTKDAEEYWHLAATMSKRSVGGEGAPLFKDAATSDIPQAARWLVPQIDRMNAEELLGIVRSIDDALNNTSLILLFDVAGKLFLFPGDAQIENWSYALFGAPAKRRAQIRERLAAANLYKVGHHGSLNATPKTLWYGFANRSEFDVPERLQSVISTRAGKHGSASRGTEVPRKKLMDELGAQSDLTTTQRATSKTTFWRDVEITLP